MPEKKTLNEVWHRTYYLVFLLQRYLAGIVVKVLKSQNISPTAFSRVCQVEVEV